MKENINGIFLLDKPLGGSSNHALQQVKHLFNAAKAGHTGSLDPLATGMLPICFGEATKYSSHLLEANKCYEVTALLGIRTDTGDLEGQVIYEAEKEGKALNPAYFEAAFLSSILDEFKGEIKQIPPMYSALKHKGKPLYTYARKGEVIERESRSVTLFEITILNQDAALKTISLRVHCSKGTYIRTLIDDIGQRLGCGAHVIALRRLWVEPFQSFPMLSLDELKKMPHPQACLLAVDAALRDWPHCILSEAEVKRLLHGLPLFLSKEAGLGYVRFYTQGEFFLGIGCISPQGEVSCKRLVNFDKNLLVDKQEYR